MRKKLAFLISLFIMLSPLASSLTSTLEYPGTTMETEAQELTVNIEKGWNLVQGFANPDWIVSGGVQPSDIQAIYALKNPTQTYVRFYPEPELDVISASDFRWSTAMGQNAFWVYSSAQGRMTYVTKESAPLDSVYLVKGWNFVAFTNNIFYDDTFSWNKVKGSCTLERIYGWNPEEEGYGWMPIAADFESFDLNDFLGHGMVVKVSEDCTLAQSEGAANPPGIPALPEGE